MRLSVAVISLLAATSAAHAQCPIGSFPTTVNAHTVCRSASGGDIPTVGTQTCPPGYEWDFGSGGVRTCVSMDRKRQPGGNQLNPRRSY